MTWNCHLVRLRQIVRSVKFVESASIEIDLTLQNERLPISLLLILFWRIREQRWIYRYITMIKSMLTHRGRHLISPDGITERIFPKENI